MSERSCCHPLNLLQNRYIIRILTGIILVTPAVVILGSPAYYESQALKQTSHITMSIGVLSAIGISIAIMLIFIYLVHSSTGNYRVRICCLNNTSGVVVEVCL